MVDLNSITDAAILNWFLKILFWNRPWFLDIIQSEYIMTWYQCFRYLQIPILGWAGQNNLQKCPSLTKFLPNSFLCQLKLQQSMSKWIPYLFILMADSSLVCVLSYENPALYMWKLLISTFLSREPRRKTVANLLRRPASKATLPIKNWYCNYFTENYPFVEVQTESIDICRGSKWEHWYYQVSLYQFHRRKVAQVKRKEAVVKDDLD